MAPSVLSALRDPSGYISGDFELLKIRVYLGDYEFGGEIVVGQIVVHRDFGSDK